MHGPEILVRTLQVPSEPDKTYGNRWQYHSRSDRHSKVGCWGVAFDLLLTSSTLRRHAQQGKVILGVNHEMRDFATGRKKRLDLVVARPTDSQSRDTPSFAELASKYRLRLTQEEQALLNRLPTLRVGTVGAVLVALEAKAAMTAHVKALPRLYDELNSSHLCVHGASKQALAIAYVQVNASREFISTDINKWPLSEHAPVVSTHNQPAAALRVLQKVGEIPRRSASSEVGFDGIGVTVLDLRNDGGDVKLVHGSPAPQLGDQFDYSGLIVRMANEYDALFGRI